MRLVILESPYAGDVERNVRYARACMKDCLDRGEAPFASHLLYTQPGVLDDSVTEERWLGLDAAHAWLQKADRCVVYTDLGYSGGMTQGIYFAKLLNVCVEYRTLGGEWEPEATR